MATLHLAKHLDTYGKLAVCPTNVTARQTTHEIAKVTCKDCRAWLKRRGVVAR